MTGLVQGSAAFDPQRSKTVQTLAWLLQSPSLLSDEAASHWGSAAELAVFSPSETAMQVDWLDSLALNQSALLEWVDKARDRSQGPVPGDIRLGRLAERLLEFFLQHGPSHHLVVANLPLRRAVKAQGETGINTIGEIDFLLRDGAGRALHWELTVKYFLCRTKGKMACADDFVGPEGVETLQDKLEKLFTRQLLHKPPAPWADTHWRPQAFTRGWMFYRLGQPIPDCELLNPGHNKGWWLPFEALTELGSVGELRYLELEKRDWMPPIFGELPKTNNATSMPVPVADLPQFLSKRWQQQTFRKASARLVVQLKCMGEQQWVEVSRGFILPPQPM